MPFGSRLKKRFLCNRAAGYRILLLSLPKVILLSFFLVPLNVLAAEDIKLAAEFNYANSQIDTRSNETGNVNGSDFTSLRQNYNIALSRQPYPFLTLDAGSSFELYDSTSSSNELSATRGSQNIRPFLEINLNSPLYAAGIGYSKNQSKNDITDVIVIKEFQESIDLSFTYRPAGLPLLRMFHTRSHNYDDPLTTDTVTSQSTAKATYSFKNLPLSYTYGRGELTDKLTDFKVLTESHEMSTSYSLDLFNNRLNMAVAYSGRFNIATAPVTGGSTEFPLSPAQGLYSADDSPLDGPALTPLTSLIDGNLTASTGINIGWAASGEVARNIGIDFGLPLRVDHVRIYVDRNIPVTPSSSFSWSVYTSPDNTDTSVWTLHATVFPASFTVFRNSFEISFSEVTTRFIKVVVTPLSATFIGNSQLENIFVTEIEASITGIVTEDQKTTNNSQNISLGLAGILSDKTQAGYNLLYATRENNGDQSSGASSLSNSLFVTHIFNRMFTGSARVSRDESTTTSSDETTKKTVSHDYSVNIIATYLETLSQTLAMGRTEKKTDRGKQTTSSIFLRTNAALYRGWDAFLDVGYGWDNIPDAGETTNAYLTTQTSVVPNDKISFDATYSMVNSKVKEEGTFTSKRTYDIRASYFPYRNLTFSGLISISEQSDQDSKQVLQSYAASWSPFRGGDIQIFLTYNESRRPSDNQEERTMGPLIKWNINRYASLDVAYYYSTLETALETTKLLTLTSKLTMTF